jgi:hypothetical protein
MKDIKRFVENQEKDGLMPVCPHCGAIYTDACYGKVKNYPDDGMLAVFMKCENGPCGEEAQALFRWDKRD